MVNKNDYAKIKGLGKKMLENMTEYYEELEKCTYTAEDLPIIALKKRTSGKLSTIQKQIEKSLQWISGNMDGIDV